MKKIVTITYNLVEKRLIAKLFIALKYQIYN